MIRSLSLAMLLSALAINQGAFAQTRNEAALDANGNLNSLIARLAAALNVR
jgi:hypothetical protein